MRRVLVIVIAAFAVVLAAAPAMAHPLGNFTINTYDGLRVSPGELSIDHVTDMAEIPTFQQRDSVEVDGNGAISAGEASAYAATACATVGRQETAVVDGEVVSLDVRESSVTFPPGAGGLPTTRVTCLLGATLARGGHRIVFSDKAFADHIGWHEITAVGDRATLSGSTVPTGSTSDRLTAYPQDLLRSPLDVRHASLSFSPGGPAASAEQPARTTMQARGVDRATQAFTGLVARQRLTPAFGALALVLAIALGAMHALAPGHGKTVMAAYLVGKRGSRRQAAVIAGTVTATHTAGVVALGVLLSASSAIAPEKLYPWLGLASGVMICSIGAGLLRRALRARAGHRHEHGDHDHEHEPVRVRSLVGLGLAGGMVPSPSALVVLLAAIALHRLWFGVVLVVAYGAGMAASLTGIGLVLVRARGVFAARPRLARLVTVLPVATATVVLAAGAVLAARGAVAI